ncbi:MULTISPECIES: hypothetical protein [unclassified Motilimonas]|uniref:hypothetical protein n=1 Tax=unclassified Motilimonas TaxID=2643697 RepID=UPI001E4F4BB5|nr:MULTISPECIES: hypothetical protein [unclassified Motilimonas]MCE0558649.1 hypothetical protein [Motilimonas sp. E26]MDO6525679.1 hypothetical protein [Motilimonas sp. 1_MG-2023]
MMTAGNSRPLVSLVGGFLLIVPHFTYGQESIIKQEYKCALQLENGEPYLGHFSYFSNYPSDDKMQQDIKKSNITTVYDTDGKTPIGITKWVECVAKTNSFQTKAAQNIEQTFDQ